MPTKESLQKLAALGVRSGLGVIQGQEVIIVADVSQQEFARMCLVEAYKSGAKAVHMMYADDQSALLKYQFGSDEAVGFAPSWLPDALAKTLSEGTGYLRIASSDPSLLKGVDADKIAKASRAHAEASKGVSEAITGGACNWCIIPAASAGWAKHVFPGDSEPEAVEKLWNAIFKCTRADQPDPAQAWRDHCSAVLSRVKQLNDSNFASLHFKGPGTDLVVGLADGHVWEGVEMHAKNGAVCSPNIPTEEVFTMPHRSRVDGTVCSTKPLSLRGQILDGIKVTFKDGKVVEATAEKGFEVLEKLLDSDEGARRLGEVALVPHSSPISQSGLTFFNTLFDENASCHIALGRSYSSTLAGYDSMSTSEREAKGSNDSIIHVDWMIGSDSVDVDGISHDGTRVPVMRGCEWA